MTVDSSAERGNPDGFEFQHDFVFACDCGQRVQMSDTEYERLCSNDEPLLECSCGIASDLSPKLPVLRSLEDQDLRDDYVDRHFWYHTSEYQDWPAPSYRDDMIARYSDCDFAGLDPVKIIARKTSLALHVGTYAAAIENMIRRMHHQPAQGGRYWLHQVEIQLQPGELAPDVHDELCDLAGGVALTALSDLGAKAVRYVNTFEAKGSISLAVTQQVISRIRTKPLPVPAAVVPVAPVAEHAIGRAIADLAHVEQLRPDPAGLPEDQIFDSGLDIALAEHGGRIVVDEAKQYTQQLEMYEDRQLEIRSTLRTDLLNAYLPRVTVQLRDELRNLISLGDDLREYHQQVRELFSLVAQPFEVIRQFEAEPWRTLEGTS
ncbi:hypothetical protein [Nocardia sp. NPDC055049]